MADVYQRDGIGFNGAMAADAAKLTFKGLGNDGVGMLAQNINLSYTQQITKIYELGSNNVSTSPDAHRVRCRWLAS